MSSVSARSWQGLLLFFILHTVRRSTPKPFDRSYWVVPNNFLADAYPGSKDAQEAQEKVSGLVNCGIRRIINLMEEHETNYGNERFVPYEELLSAVSKRFGVSVRVSRHPIRDLHVPSAREMIQILDIIDQSISTELPVYIHCWGGVGRTGTVVGCYLIRHGMAAQTDVSDRISFLRREEFTAYRHHRRPTNKDVWFKIGRRGSELFSLRAKNS